MCIFYFDKNIEKFEKNKDFKNLILYLENNIPFSEKNFATQIAYTWLLFAEGRYYDTERDYEFYFQKWKEKIKYSITKTNYKLFPEICFISAYTLNISGMFIDELDNYEILVQKLENLCITNSSNNEFIKFYRYFIPPKLHFNIDKEYIDKILKNNSLVDRYFMDILYQ